MYNVLLHGHLNCTKTKSFFKQKEMQIIPLNFLSTVLCCQFETNLYLVFCKFLGCVQRLSNFAMLTQGPQGMCCCDDTERHVSVLESLWVHS